MTIRSVSQGTVRFNVKYVSYPMQYNYAALRYVTTYQTTFLMSV